LVIYVKLKIPIEIAVCNSLPESRFYAANAGQDFDVAAYFAAEDQAQGDRIDQAKQPVPTDSQAEKLRILSTAACAHLALRIDEHKRLDIGDDGFHVQTSPMHVGG
jgi:hypothetical protein